MKNKNRKERFNIEVRELKRSEQCKHNHEPILNSEGFYECPGCGKYGEYC